MYYNSITLIVRIIFFLSFLFDGAVSVLSLREMIEMRMYKKLFFPTLLQIFFACWLWRSCQGSHPVGSFGLIVEAVLNFVFHWGMADANWLQYKLLNRGMEGRGELALNFGLWKVWMVIAALYAWIHLFLITNICIAIGYLGASLS